MYMYIVCPIANNLTTVFWIQIQLNNLNVNILNVYIYQIYIGTRARVSTNREPLGYLYEKGLNGVCPSSKCKK